MPIATMTLREYLIRISHFLRENIEYTEENLPQDPTSVLINNRANCVGYANVFSVFLNSAKIKNRIIKGFYLERKNGPSLIPVPHRWLEIELLNGFRFFYDPQYNNFSANYIVVKDDVDFKKIKRFDVVLIKKSKEFVN
jgi:transglutaminase-like putative cysteine protease